MDRVDWRTEFFFQKIIFYQEGLQLIIISCKNTDDLKYFVTTTLLTIKVNIFKSSPTSEQIGHAWEGYLQKIPVMRQ
jgi:hypothetical protein